MNYQTLILPITLNMAMSLILILTALSLSEPPENKVFDTEPTDATNAPKDHELNRLHATIRTRSILPDPPFQPIPGDNPPRAA